MVADRYRSQTDLGLADAVKTREGSLGSWMEEAHCKLHRVDAHHTKAEAAETWMPLTKIRSRVAP